MRKAKVITALALTVVMLVAMTGIATAETYTFEDVGVYDQYGNLLTGVTIEVRDGAGNLIASNTTQSTVTVSVPESGLWCLNIVNGDEVVQYGCFVIPDQLAEFELALYNLNLIVGSGDPDEIPEFSTIALPVASILGLLFFFNHRKHRKR